MQRKLAQRVSGAATQPSAIEMRYKLGIGEAPEETATLTVTPDQARHLAAAGWDMPAGPAFYTKRVPLQTNNPWTATVWGVQKTGEFIVNTYFTLVRLIQGAISPEAVRGPVGIVDAGTTVAQRGFSWLLFFLGLISINLAVINFLPIPVLDGGHIVFLIIEKIKGSPPSPAVQNAALFAGLALIGCVFLLVTYNDIARLVTGG
jgi:regulator of sigma E protease